MSLPRHLRRLGRLALFAPSLLAACSSEGGLGSSSDEQVQGLSVLKDIRQTDKAPSDGSSPDFFVALGGKTYFTAVVGAHENESERLFVTDGTAAGTSEIAVVGKSPFDRSPMVVHGGKLYLIRPAGLSSVDLIESDGTTAGTKVVATLSKAKGWATAETLTSTPHGLLFFANTHSDEGGRALYRLGPNGAELVYPPPATPPTAGSSMYNARIVTVGTRTVILRGSSPPLLTDGTTAGTIEIAGVSKALYAAALGPSSIVFASPGTGPGEIAVYDAVAGTVSTVAKPQSAGAAWPVEIRALASVGGRVVLAGIGYENGVGSFAELWSTDGTAQGTALIATSQGVAKVLGGSIVRIAEASGSHYFLFEGGATFATADGTQATTRAIAGFPALQKGNTVSSSVSSLASDGAKLYAFEGGGLLDAPYRVQVFDPATGITTTTTSEDAAPTRRSSALVPTAQGIVYACRGGSQRGEPCLSDGTDAGTQRIKRLGETRLQSSRPAFFQRVADKVYFTADDGIHGEELWVTDGSAGGTHLVKDVTPGPDATTFRQMGILRGKTPRVLGSTYLFTTAKTISGSEFGSLYRTDGTDAGTWRIDELIPAGYTKYARLPDPIVAGSHIYYVAKRADGASELRRSDGSANAPETLAVLDTPSPDVLFPPSYELVATGNHVLALPDRMGNGVSNPWRSDGTAAGTQKLVVSGEIIAAGNGVAYFAESWSGSTPTKLTRYDEVTGALTTQALPALADPNGGPYSRYQKATGCAEMLGTDVVFYTRAHGGKGAPTSVWKSDGTEAGTTRLAELPGAARECETILGALGKPDGIAFAGHALIPVDLEEGGRRALVTDGTPAGTQELDLGRYGDLIGVSAAKGLLFFKRDSNLDEIYGYQGGVTTLLADTGKALAPNAELPASRYHVEVPGGLVFVASARGVKSSRVLELDWATGATRDLTGAARDPWELAVVGNRLLVSAEDGNADRELWGGAITVP